MHILQLFHPRKPNDFGIPSANLFNLLAQLYHHNTCFSSQSPTQPYNQCRLFLAQQTYVVSPSNTCAPPVVLTATTLSFSPQLQDHTTHQRYIKESLLGQRAAMHRRTAITGPECMPVTTPYTSVHRRKRRREKSHEQCWHDNCEILHVQTTRWHFARPGLSSSQNAGSTPQAFDLEHYPSCISNLTSQRFMAPRSSSKAPPSRVHQAARQSRAVYKSPAGGLPDTIGFQF
jgi:hypothetical protein